MKSEEIDTKEEMVVKKKLDIFNLFYSGAAVVILIGVIAKLLEWPAQDLLITLGLTIEAIVFGVSAVKFVEVQVKRQVATEETLAKLAEGISAISDTMGSAGDDNSSTYVNIQTGAFEGAGAPVPADSVRVGGSTLSQGFDLSAYKTDYVAPKNDTRLDKLSIEINPSINETRHRSSSNDVISNGGVDLNNYLTGGSGAAIGGTNVGGGRNYSDLEQLAITSLAKDLFYHPEWAKFNDSEYVKLTDVFKNLFDKKLPSKESVVLLSQFQVKFPAI
jgi:phenylpyruvate tautomerase PptA (4-oxalocrotonate tautomerase family)